MTSQFGFLQSEFPEIYDPVFLSDLLQTPSVQVQMDARTGQVTIGKLALFRIEQIEIPLPPIHLQRDFALRAAEIDKLSIHYRAHLQKLESLFSSLQHRAFTGELNARRSSPARSELRMAG